jgi:nucleoid DNA-binding protein
MNVTQKIIAAKISERTGLSRHESKKALKSVLGCIQRALGDGKAVSLGKLGKMKVVTRKPTRRIDRNLNGIATINNVYSKHPKTVRLLGGQDLSENSQHTRTRAHHKRTLHIFKRGYSPWRPQSGDQMVH